jgi:beta-galactosidase
MGAVRLDTYAGTTGAANGAEVRGWRMRGGLGPEDPATGWQPFTGATGRPAFYRARFTLPAVPEGVNPVYRITWEGLSRGFIWLNGHNLGRCPDRLTPSLYMPEPWLLSGENTIVVFDENGRAPTAVRIVTDANATRQALTLAQSGS